MNCFRTFLLIYTALLLHTFCSWAQATDAKLQPVFKTARLYNGLTIEKVVPTADNKGVVITTTDNKTYFLNRDEAKQKLDIQLTSDGYILPKDVGVIFYDKNGVPSDSYRNYNYVKMDRRGPSDADIRIFIENSKADTTQPLYLLNGKEISKEEMQQLDPSTIEKVDVLKSDAAVLAYGERARNGVVVITLKATAKDTVRATFPGGITGWRRYIERSLNYPRAAQNNRTQGVIKVLITISETGKITSAKALNNPGDGLAEEAERVLKESPAWIPATLDGKPFPVSFVQKITFRMS